MQTLLEDLLAKAQRETAGSDAVSRFDYQKNWGFCEMLRRHMAGADYLVAFEFHDDILFLTPSIVPTSAEFFQVKTSRSATSRKLTDLTYRKSKQSNSILGKMFMNFGGICSTHATQVILVSNVPFEFADSNLSAKDLDQKYRNKIIAKLKAELPTFSEAQIDHLHFMITGVSIDTIQSFLHGEAMELFKVRFGEDHGLNVHSWVRLLQSEIARKNNYLSDKVQTLADLISNKCISRQVVEDSLSIVSARRRTAPDMTIVYDELKGAGWSPQDLMRLNKKMPQAASDYTDSTTRDVNELVKKLRGVFVALFPASDLASYIATVEQSILPGLPAPYNDRLYLAALGIVVYYEEI